MTPTKLPQTGAYPEFYKPYITALDSDNLLDTLDQVHLASIGIFRAYPESKWEYRYAPGKWNVKELLGHLIDAERIFCTRALRFARLDKTELPGFDQNAYVPESNVAHRSVPDLLDEWTLLRKATVKMFANLTPEMLQREGIASGWPITVMALGFVIAGHEKHHQNIFQERYL